jgi:glycosyltransferase involved in cell wall biosynthesis
MHDIKQAEGAIRVLHICRRYRPLVGGTEKSVHDLAVAQSEAGCRVTILTLDHDVVGPVRGLPEREELEGLTVVRVPGWGFAQIAFTYRPDRIWREIARHDVVHIHDLRFAMATAVAGGVIARRPRIFHTHGLIFHTSGGLRLKRLAMRSFFGPLLRIGGVRTVASSEADRKLLLRDAPYLRARTDTYTNAIPLGPLLGLERDPIPGRVISIGRIVPNKALSDLVRALARLKGVKWSLVLAGEPSADELAKVKGEVARQRVQDRVSFVLGFPEEDLPGLLKSSAVAAFPSTGEGFGIALLEAMATGVPVVARRIPAHELLLGPDLDWLLVDFDDADGAAATIRSLLEAQPERLAELRRQLQDRAAAYDISRLREQIEGLYAVLHVTARGKRRRGGGEDR